jgi:hypothetical protein
MTRGVSGGTSRIHGRVSGETVVLLAPARAATSTMVIGT